MKNRKRGKRRVRRQSDVLKRAEKVAAWINDYFYEHPETFRALDKICHLGKLGLGYDRGGHFCTFIPIFYRRHFARAKALFSQVFSGFSPRPRVVTFAL